MKRRNVVFSTIIGIVFGFCLAAGKRLDETLFLDMTDAGFYFAWGCLALFCGVVTYLLWSVWGKVKVCNIELSPRVKDVLDRVTGEWSIGIFLLVWLPTWLSIFPGVFAYDAYDEWQQVATGQLTAHHPILHVLFSGGIAELFGQLFANYNMGIAVSTFIQMLLLAMTFSYTLCFLREQNVSVWIRLFAVVFYAFSPIVQLFAVCTTKDTLYAAALLLFLISLFRIFQEQGMFAKKRNWQIVFVVSSLGVMILRNNGKYVVLIMLLLLLIVCKSIRKKCFCYCGIIVGLYWLYANPLHDALEVQDGSVAEMLSVPLQQIARVYNYEENAFSEEELEYLYALVPRECWQAYRSTVSDFVKRGFDEKVFKDDPMRFVSLWLTKGREHPLVYVNSFLVGTVDYWYPFAVVDGYQDVYGKSSLFDYRVSEPGEEHVYIPWLHEWYERLAHDVSAQKIPGMFLLVAPGWYLWIALLVMAFLLKSKQYRQTFSLLPLILNFLTVLLGPIALVRYVLILYFAVPIYALFFTASDS